MYFVLPTYDMKTKFNEFNEAMALLLEKG